MQTAKNHGNQLFHTFFFFFKIINYIFFKTKGVLLFKYLCYLLRESVDHFVMPFFNVYYFYFLHFFRAHLHSLKQAGTWNTTHTAMPTPSAPVIEEEEHHDTSLLMNPGVRREEKKGILSSFREKKKALFS